MRAPLALSLLLPIAACGPATPPVTAPPAASASATGSAIAATPAPLPSELPAKQPVPPPGVRGSDELAVEEDAALFRCQAPVDGGNAAAAARRAEACAKTAGAWTRALTKSVTQADGDAAAKIPLPVEAGRCYRVYIASDVPANVTVRDSKGKDAADDDGPALPRAGRLCAKASGAATLLVAVGAGKGTVAIDVWATAK